MNSFIIRNPTSISTEYGIFVRDYSRGLVRTPYPFLVSFCIFVKYFQQGFTSHKREARFVSARSETALPAIVAVVVLVVLLLVVIVVNAVVIAVAVVVVVVIAQELRYL